MTTKDRPELLGPSLTAAVRETARIGGQFFVFDDHSTHPQTLELFKQHKLTVITRPEHEHPGHDAMQRHFLFMMKTVTAEWPTLTEFIKLDDDIDLMEDAFGRMFAARERAKADGHAVGVLGGLRTKNEKVLHAGDGYDLLRDACNACVVYDVGQWREILGKGFDQHAFTNMGYDWYFGERYRHTRLAGQAVVVPNPSVCYHAGHSGIHTINKDINVNYGGARL
jgi:hypothetical protein